MSTAASTQLPGAKTGLRCDIPNRKVLANTRIWRNCKPTADLKVFNTSNRKLRCYECRRNFQVDSRISCSGTVRITVPCRISHSLRDRHYLHVQRAKIKSQQLPEGGLNHQSFPEVYPAHSQVMRFVMLCFIAIIDS